MKPLLFGFTGLLTSILVVHAATAQTQGNHFPSLSGSLKELRRLKIL